MISRAIAFLAMGVAMFAASPAYCGDPLTINEDGTYDSTFFSDVTSTPIAGGGVDFFDPAFAGSFGGTYGDFLVYEPDGVTPGDLVRLVPHGPSCTGCVDIDYYVLSGGKLEADVTSLPSYSALLGTATEHGFYGFFSVQPNGFTIFGRASHTEISAVPEPSTWLLMIAGVAGLGFASRRRRAFAG